MSPIYVTHKVAGQRPQEGIVVCCILDCGKPQENETVDSGPVDMEALLYIVWLSGKWMNQLILDTDQTTGLTPIWLHTVYEPI